MFAFKKKMGRVFLGSLGFVFLAWGILVADRKEQTDNFSGVGHSMLPLFSSSGGNEQEKKKDFLHLQLSCGL